MDISVVIPLFNEEESLPELHEWIVRVMKANNFSYEIVFIDDGSKDKSWKVISELSEKNPCVKAIKFINPTQINLLAFIIYIQLKV